MSKTLDTKTLKYKMETLRKAEKSVYDIREKLMAVNRMSTLIDEFDCPTARKITKAADALMDAIAAAYDGTAINES